MSRVIRRGRPGDRPALDRLQSHLRRPSPELLNAALTEASVSSTVESSLVSGAASGTELSAFDLFVAVDERAERSVVGYLLAVRGDPTHVAEVAVAPDHRREGHARALLDRLFATVVERHGEDNEDLHRVRLAVEPDNDAALELYRSAGFTVARRDPNYLDGDPALLLVKSVGCEST